jgi:hypothetical protein
MGRPTLAEIKTIFWLQFKLTAAMFRSRRLHMWARLGQILLMLLVLSLTLPFFVAMGIALGAGMAIVSPQAAFELAILANSALLFFWLLLPASYSSQIVERFEMSRLFVYPIRFSSLVIGSTLVSFLSFVGVWTIPLLLGEVVGLAWHQPWLLPLILLGAIPTFAILLLSGRLMDDVLDLVSSDRRLRGLLLFLLSLPFILLLFGNYYIQIAAQDPEAIKHFFEVFAGDLPSLENLSFVQGIDLLLVNLRLSRYLLWFPPGWGTAGMALVVAGRWLEGLGFLVLAFAFSGGLLWAHARLTRRLMQGAVVRLGAERVRSRGWGLQLPGPADFWTLFRKDWLYLRRNPSTFRTLLATPIVVVAFGVGLWQMADLLSGNDPLSRAVPMMAATLMLVSVSLSTANLVANYFGAVDREGLVTLMLAPVPRTYVFLSANAVTIVFALAQSLVLLLLVAAFTGDWGVLPWGFFLAFCLNLATAPLYNLAAILAPYRAPLQVWGGRGGNMGGFIAGMVGIPPVLSFFWMPYIFWRSGQFITLPLALFYALGLYALTLKPLARLLDRRTHQLIEAVQEEA